MEIGSAHHHMTERDEESFAVPTASYHEQPAAPEQRSAASEDPRQVDYLNATSEQIEDLDKLLLRIMHNLM